MAGVEEEEEKASSQDPARDEDVTEEATQSHAQGGAGAAVGRMAGDEDEDAGHGRAAHLILCYMHTLVARLEFRACRLAVSLLQV